MRLRGNAGDREERFSGPTENKGPANRYIQLCGHRQSVDRRACSSKTSSMNTGGEVDLASPAVTSGEKAAVTTLGGLNTEMPAHTGSKLPQGECRGPRSPGGGSRTERGWIMDLPSWQL